ncbi:hypothetical protein FRC14_002860 [Serendipita sp. 396]|nr:hypothetical protein FRC14_002860 [Serendipita sp. 396]
MSLLKRTASIAFLNDEQPATSPVATTSYTLQLSRPNRNRPLGHSKSAVFPQRSPIIKSRSLMRRGYTFQSTEHARSTNAQAHSRSIKRQKITSKEDTLSSDWQVVVGQSIADNCQPYTATPSCSDATNLSSRIFLASYNFISSLGFSRSSQPAHRRPELPHVADDQPSSKSIEMEMDHGDIDEENHMDIEGESAVQVTQPQLPPSPIPAYTPLQWRLLSRHPHLVEKALSAQMKSIRIQHDQFIRSNYVKHANPRFHPAKERRSSPLTSGPTVLRTSYAHTKEAPVMHTDRSVRRAQGQPESTKQTRWANYPTCSEKYPGPDKPGSIIRNTLLLNFGEWLKKANLWVSVRTAGIRMAMSWYETYGGDEEGSITPEVDHEMLGSIADITAAHFTR